MQPIHNTTPTYHASPHQHTLVLADHVPYIHRQANPTHLCARVLCEPPLLDDERVQAQLLVGLLNDLLLNAVLDAEAEHLQAHT
jgi:hypothetical protein